jgi:signal transduction histidine kinase
MGVIVAFFSFIGNLNQSTVTLSGNVFVSCTYVIASLVGFTIAQWLESARLQEEKAFQEQELIYERKRLQLTQTIHDSVAGSLSYGVLRMRQIESTLHHQDEELIASLGDVEDIMRQALTSIRSEILESSNVTLHENGKDSDVFRNEEDLRTVLLDMKHRLDALGFDGEALLVGDTERITHIPREVVGIIRELGNNISKYAEKRSSYALIVSLRTSQKLDIYEANVSTEHNDDTLSGGTGFNRIRQVVNLLGGECNAGVEEREWCVFIQLPLLTAL